MTRTRTPARTKDWRCLRSPVTPIAGPVLPFARVVLAGYSAHADAVVGCGGCPGVRRRELFLRGGRVGPLFARHMADASIGATLTPRRGRGRALAVRTARPARDH